MENETFDVSEAYAEETEERVQAMINALIGPKLHVRTYTNEMWHRQMCQAVALGVTVTMGAFPAKNAQPNIYQVTSYLSAFDVVPSMPGNFAEIANIIRSGEYKQYQVLPQKEQ